MKPFITACLIVKNEEHMLRKCLESLENVVGEVVVVDTGSTDLTKEIAMEFTNKVFDFEWKNDFAEARNFAASKASGEWIIAVDADEIIDPDNLKSALEEIKSQSGKYNMYAVEILNFVDSFGENITTNKMGRVYKNDGTVCFKGRIHEQLVSVVKEEDVILSSIKIYHYGYLQQVVEKQDKKNRNLKIIKNILLKEKNDGFVLFNYGQELRRLGNKKEALDTFIKAYKCKTDVEAGWIRMCLFFIIEGLVEFKRYEEALEIIHDVEVLWPKAPDFIFWKGDIYFLQNRFDDARTIYQGILENGNIYNETIYDFDRKSFLPHKRLGVIYEIEKNDKQALEHYIKALNENSSSIETIVRVIKILSRYHTVQEIYEFLEKQNILKTDAICFEVIKCTLSLGLGDLSLLLIKELKNTNKPIVKSLELKAQITMTTVKFLEFGTEDLLFGIQSGIFDLADLCILYEITGDIRIKTVFESTKFLHIFNIIFEGNVCSESLEQKEYLGLLERAIRYNKPDLVEKLINNKYLMDDDIDAKIADLFYENGYEDIALEFYRLVDEEYITQQGYINVIEWLILQDNKREANRLVLEAINKFTKDYRFYKYLINISLVEKKQSINNALNVFPDSNWLKEELGVL
ncbi:tetratricopeptide repeat-containing glycosyltransferase family 2 protein [Bacillus mobilis]|uniref:tetratricopeptide repeat-containing glycosyltransferase family 2 protein n=1 Tax=Bacillus mobilis TaxID=2026190 RepID=UPI0021CFEBDB|nr:TPR domain-containing glycosyltransferase [Bacillus mobilis]MCU5195942.1 glycosyltransferase [Bacillus mobilis]